MWIGEQIMYKIVYTLIDIYTIMCAHTGTSPHTYFEDLVRPGENVVRVRSQCLGQVNDRPTKDFTIGMFV